MKLKYDFTVREVVGEFVLIPMGADALAFSGMVTTNEVGAAVCQALREETTVDAILAQICDEFEVEPEEARADILEFLETLRKVGLLAE